MIWSRSIPILFILAVIVVFVILRIRRASTGPTETQRADEQETGRGILYADLSVLQMMSRAIGAEPSDEPWFTFQSTAMQLRRKDRVPALESLRRIAADPGMNTQMQLLAWRLLRESGEQPDARSADAVQAVVIEIPIRNNRDVAAVYRDGLIKCLTGFGKWTGRNASEDPAVADLMNEARSARPLLPLSPGRPPRTPILPRVAILTFGGIYVLDLDPALVETSSEPPYAVYRAVRKFAQ